MAEDIVRVLRIIEYIGPRSEIEKVMTRSLHGTKEFRHEAGDVTIRAATLGEFPEILEIALIKNQLAIEDARK